MTTPKTPITEEAKRAVEEAEARLTDAKRDLDHVLAVTTKFPDASLMREWFSRLRNWSSHLAHEVVTHVDPEQIAYQFRYSGNIDRRLSFACEVMYVEVETPSGAVRVYSSRPVDLIAGFDAYNASGGKTPLIDCLRATTKKAEEALAKYKREREEAEAKEAEEATKKKAEADIKLGVNKPSS